MYVAAFPLASKAKIPMISLHFIHITSLPLSDGPENKTLYLSSFHLIETMKLAH